MDEFKRKLLEFNCSGINYFFLFLVVEMWTIVRTDRQGSFRTVF